MDKSEALYVKSLESWDAIHGADSVKTIPLEVDIATLQTSQQHYEPAMQTWKRIQQKYEVGKS
jgi:hypothetical protein